MDERVRREVTAGVRKWPGAGRGGRIQVFGALLGLVLVLSWGCEGGTSRLTGPTTTDGATATTVSAGAKTVTAHLRDPFLFDHNAHLFGGRTFRWVTPIPIHAVTGDPPVDDFLLQQFLAWEAALGGAGGVPFFEVLPMAQQLPERGIFFVIADLPEPVVGIGDPVSLLAESRRSGSQIIQGLRQRGVQIAARRVEVPEIQAGGDISRCQIALDPSIETLSTELLARLIRHEVGHCLGFIGHVPRGVMATPLNSPATSLAITPDVAGMMQRLYRLPPSTPITR